MRFSIPCRAKAVIRGGLLYLCVSADVICVVPSAIQNSMLILR